MPLYALDENNRIISAQNADSFHRYRCVECKSLVQKRTGTQRQAHFYHLQTVRSCRLHSQSIDHSILQSHLIEKNPILEIEKPFEKILRIADLCWEEKKIIFEIQCSPITVEEVSKRKKDYQEEGYDLIWLLDDRLFNHKKLRVAENQLRKQGCYYFTLSKTLLYDQFAVLLEDALLFKGPPLPIDLLHCYPAFHPQDQWVEQLRLRESKHYFKGDLFDRSIRYPIYSQRLKEHEEDLLKKQPKKGLVFLIKKCFFIAWEWILRLSLD